MILKNTYVEVTIIMNYIFYNPFEFVRTVGDTVQNTAGIVCNIMQCTRINAVD